MARNEGRISAMLGAMPGPSLIPRYAALALLVTLGGCGSDDTSVEPNQPDPCDGIGAPKANWALPTLTVGETGGVAILSFDTDVSGVTVGASVVIDGGQIGKISGGPSEYQVPFEGLTPGMTVRLSVLGRGDIRSLDCNVAFDSDLDASAVVPIEPWRHSGDITRASAPPRTAAPWFVEKTADVGLDSLELDAGRAMLVDFDGDGREDIVTLPVTNSPLRPRFVRNASEAETVRFEDRSASSGMNLTQAALLVFGDVDNDGDFDAFSGLSFRAWRGEGGYWENNGEGQFQYLGLSGTDNPVVSGGIFHEAAAATFADFDKDGFLDLYVGHWYAGSTQGNFAPTDDVLYKGGGDGTFMKVTLPDQTNPLTRNEHPSLSEAARAAYGLAVADYDEDGDIDIFVNNYGAGRPLANSPPRYWDHNLLWRNDGNMTFVDTSTTAGVAATLRGIGGVETEAPLIFQGRNWPGPIGGNGFGCQFADFDNDGDLDLIVGSIAHPDYPQSDRTMLHVNQGPPDYRFTEESAARGLEYYEDELHPVMIDVDNDGLLDLSMSRLRGESKWRLYFQKEDHTFDLRSVADTGVDIERPGPTLWFDADGDGDLDFFMAKGGGRYFENRAGTGRNYLKVSLVGTRPKDATGARVFLESSSGTQQRVLSSGESHYNSQQSRILHFGLGGDSGAGQVRVRWPNGSERIIGDVRANVHILVRQEGDVELIDQD